MFTIVFFWYAKSQNKSELSFFSRFSVKRSVFHSTRNYKSSEEDAYYAEISLKGFLKSEICHIFENSEHSGRKIQWNGSSPVDRIFPFDQKSCFHLTPFRKFNNFRILRKLSRKFRTICACFESSEILEQMKSALFLSLPYKRSNAIIITTKGLKLLFFANSEPSWLRVHRPQTRFYT